MLDGESSPNVIGKRCANLFIFFFNKRDKIQKNDFLNLKTEFRKMVNNFSLFLLVIPYKLAQT